MAQCADAIEKLESMGSAAKPATAALCALLGRSEPGPNGLPLNQSIARVLGRIGPDAAKAAVAAARADLSKPTPTVSWGDVLGSLGPNGIAPLADALADSNETVARTACQSMSRVMTLNAWDPNTAAGVAAVTPKLIAGWQRAAAAQTEPTTPYFAQAEWQKMDERRRWLDTYCLIGQMAGPKTLDALAAAAEAYLKQHRVDPARATVAVKDLAAAIAANPSPHSRDNPARDWAARKVVACGGSAIAPLANLISTTTDVETRDFAMHAINDLKGETTLGLATDPITIRNRLIYGKLPVYPLDAASRAAIAKAVPVLVKVATDTHLGTQEFIEHLALGTLCDSAPDVPAAADALISRLDQWPASMVNYVAEPLARCDAATRKKLDSAAISGGAQAKDIAWRARLRNMAPKDASAEIIAKVPAAERRSFVLKFGGGPTEAVPLLIELLPDASIGAADSLRAWGFDALGPLVAALDRPEPAIRAGAMRALPDSAAGMPVVIAKAAKLIGDGEASAAAVRLLTIAGPSALSTLVELTHSGSPVVRARAVDVLGQLGRETLNGPPSAEVTTSADGAAISLWDDSDPAVRSAALTATARLFDAARPAVAARLKSSDDDQRQRLAQMLADAAPSGMIVLSDEMIGHARQRTTPSNNGTIQPPQGPRTAGEMFGELAIDAADPAVADAAQDVLIRYDGIELDRSEANRPVATTQQTAPIVKAAADPDPAVRAKAIIDAGELRGMESTIVAALQDADPSVRVAALNVINNVLQRLTSFTPPALAKVVELSQGDPAIRVRLAAGSALLTVQRQAFVILMPRVRLLARSKQEQDRVVAAVVLGEMTDPHHPVASGNSGNGDQTPEFLVLLQRLLDDPSPAVRRAAAIALAKYVRADEPQAPAAKAVVQRLADTTKLDPDAKAAMLAVVPWLAAKGVTGLADNADSDVSAAAFLGIEQPPSSPPLTPRVPTATAIKALSSPASRVRRMAAHTLLLDDPNDATRRVQGTRALLALRSDPNSAIATDALDELVDSFCGDQLGPSYTIYSGAPSAHLIPGRAATAADRRVEGLINQAMTPTNAPADRIVAINGIATTGPRGLAVCWGQFLQLLQDDDAQVRAAAFSAAQALTVQAVTQRLPAAAVNVAGQK
jgi:hypothetical protein